MKSKKKAILWFTKNLRIQDNALINWAATNDCEVLALAFEPEGKTNRQKDCYFRAAQEIQARFKKQNLSFFVLTGNPEVEVPNWFHANSADLILTQASFNSREKRIIDRIAQGLPFDSVKTFFDQTLLAIDDLPFEVTEMPLVFSDFRKAVEANAKFPLPQKSLLEKLNGFSVVVPIGAQFCEKKLSAEQLVLPFEMQSSESASWARIEDYFFKTKSLLSYKLTRNGMLEKNDSSKLSVGLAHGSISARSIYAEVLRSEEQFGGNESTKWFKFELLWRDYFKFLALKAGDSLFSVKGLLKTEKSWQTNQSAFRQWCTGTTGVDFVDANMIELNTTGWMSNRGRQNVASYLAKQLSIDWTWGAQYFADNLIDDDIESNWGNWLYVSGSGTDPRDRIFNIQRQVDNYDPQFLYRNKWLGLKRKASQ